VSKKACFLFLVLCVVENICSPLGFLRNKFGAMVFKAEKTVAILSKDLISWTFDDNKFEQDEPVSHSCSWSRDGEF
jgi:hypothetical protein